MDKEFDGKTRDDSLYLAADQKIDKLKDQIIELFRETHSHKEQIAHLFNRLDHGISVTGQQNASKLTEIAVKLVELQNELNVEKSNIKHHERALGRILTGVFWLCFSGVLGGLVAMAYQILKTKMFGG